MDMSRCSKCKKRLIAMTARTGQTKLVCLKCDNIDPMKTVAAKWAKSSLATRAISDTSKQVTDRDLVRFLLNGAFA